MNGNASRGAAETFRFGDDGLIPNNPTLPFVVFRAAIDLSGSEDPEAQIERTFARHGWGGMWRNGVYPFAHYHSRTHEATGVARGHAKVRFGGEHGVEIDLHAGDVAVLPAGTGHQRISASSDFVVIGAYPPNGEYDLCRGSPTERAKALAAILGVPPPASDLVHGSSGPLLEFWSDASQPVPGR